MKYIVHIRTNEDTCDETYCVDTLEEVGLALSEYRKDYCECYSCIATFDVEVIPCNELKKK